MNISIRPEGKHMIYHLEPTPQELENIINETPIFGLSKDNKLFILTGKQTVRTEEAAFWCRNGMYTTTFYTHKHSPETLREHLKELGDMPVYSEESTPEKSLNLGYVRIK